MRKPILKVLKAQNTVIMGIWGPCPQGNFLFWDGILSYFTTDMMTANRIEPPSSEKFTVLL